MKSSTGMDLFQVAEGIWYSIIGLHIIAMLKTGGTWHDGRPIHSEDTAFSAASVDNAIYFWGHADNVKRRVAPLYKNGEKTEFFALLPVREDKKTRRHRRRVSTH